MVKGARGSVLAVTRLPQPLAAARRKAVARRSNGCADTRSDDLPHDGPGCM